MKLLYEKIMNNRRLMYGLIGLVITLILFLIFYEPITRDAIVEQIINDAEGSDGEYNIVSLTFYISLSINLIVIINEILLLWKVKIDLGFVLAMLPFIIFGSCLRVVEDYGFISYPISIIAVSPLIYLFVTFLILILLYFKRSFDFKLDGPRGFSLIYALVILSQALDAIITIIGVEIFNYAEKNLITTMLINSFPPSYLFYKLLLGVGFVYVFNHKTRVLSNSPTKLEYLILVGMIALGLAPAIRNLLRMVIGV